MRTSLNLALKTIDKFSLLLHGGPGTGKTHLMGDALFHEKNDGPVAYINISGQDGWLSLATYDLTGIHAETVETLDDFLECVQSFEGLQMLAVDSVRDLLRLCVVNTTGTDRPPKAGTQNNEYTQIYFDFERAIREMKKAAKRVITCSTSDRSTDQLSAQTNVVPDLAGRWGNGIASLFDFVGYLHASTVLGKIKRSLSFQPMTLSINNNTSINILTRQRLAHAINKDIEIVTGVGAWPHILQVFTEHLSTDSPEPKKKSWGKD